MRIPLTAAAGVYVALAVVVTWPQVLHLSHGVQDFGDPLHFSWTLAWVAHALTAAPHHLLDANIFFPERWTLAYSETLILPGVILAPVIWLGGDPILANNLLLLAGYALSGVTMLLLVRSLTHHDGSALVAGAIFAVYPYRIEEYPKVQLQLVFWLPLALWAMHRLVIAPTRRHVLALGASLAAQCYTCVTYATYGAVILAIVGGVALAGASASLRWPALKALGLSAILAAALALPIGAAYWSASRVVGERTVENLKVYSAVLNDYRRAHPDNAMYGDDGHPGDAERRLFPGYAGPALALAGLIPPFDLAVLAYAAAAAASVDLSLGTNGPGYQWLYDHLAPFRGLRVPARFGMLVGLSIAVLAGFGVARVAGERSRAVQIAAVLVALGVVTMEARMRPQNLVSLPDPSPSVYRWLAAQPRAVVCEYPVGNLEGRAGPQDETYMYYSTQHWQPLVNGDAGFLPKSYDDLLHHLRGFPDDEAISYLHARGVSLLLVHSAFYIRGDFNADVRALRARSDVDRVGTFRWTSGDVTEVFRVK